MIEPSDPPGTVRAKLEARLADPYRTAPDPGDLGDADELGELGELGEPDDVGELGEARVPSPGPAHTRRQWRRRDRKPKDSGGRPSDRARPPRLTAAVRQDVDAKVSFALEIPGRLWAARDPVCGTAFVDQRPEISAALTEIICNSPDLLAWFTGAGGGYLLYLNLLATLWPVATLWMAHHIYHTIDGDQAAADDTAYGRYAA